MIEISESGKTLDARGLFCPSPVMQTNVELSKMQIGEILTVLADDPAADDPAVRPTFTHSPSIDPTDAPSIDATNISNAASSLSTLIATCSSISKSINTP